MKLLNMSSRKRILRHITEALLIVEHMQQYYSEVNLEKLEALEEEEEEEEKRNRKHIINYYYTLV